MVSKKKLKGSSRRAVHLHLDVIMNNLKSNPHCPHGPTLLFKQMKKGKERRFYACAACRDRKLCNFFHSADEEFGEEKKETWELEKEKLMLKESPKELYKRFRSVHKKVSAGKQAMYCHDCCKLLLPDESEVHDEHDVTTDVSLRHLLHPSELLKPLETNTKEAQYLFTKSTTDTIIKAAKNMNIKNVLCIGTPRLHELICAEGSGDMRSLLLDIDRRYYNFYKSEDFCWFNAFNNHFFLGDSSKAVLTNFLQLDGGEGMMMIVDPPFGGRVEPLAYTIRKIQKSHRKLNPQLQQNMGVMFISPYFMEHHILASFPDFQMLDYKIAYDNHPLFSLGAKARKIGSPVRIFTNIAPKCVPLPPEEGYRFCKPCKRWVSEENKHCDDCMKCTSKNGCTYTHCSECQRCVKPNWQHCNTCQRCLVFPHKCGSFKPSGVCYKCGKKGHKKYDCPGTDGEAEPVVSRKRKHSDQQKVIKRKKNRET